MEDFIQEMDTAGVDLAVAPYRAAWGDPVNNRPPTDNGELVELMDAYPDRILGVPGISPVYHSPDEIEAQINKYVINGPLRGVAVEPAIDKSRTGCSMTSGPWSFTTSAPGTASRC